MARKCEITGKKAQMANRVSHSNQKTKVRLQPNLQSKRFYLPSENRFVKLKLSTSGIREIDKRGIEAVVKELRENGVAV